MDLRKETHASAYDAVAPFLIMRPSSLRRGRILRRTLSVCLSVRLSVRPSRASRSGASLGAT